MLQSAIAGLYLWLIRARRILAWNTFPTRSYQPADFAINTDNHSVAVAAGPSCLAKRYRSPSRLAPAATGLWAPTMAMAGPIRLHEFLQPTTDGKSRCLVRLGGELRDDGLRQDV